MELFERDFAHEFVAHDLANLHPLNGSLALRVYAALDLIVDRVELGAQPIHRCHVGELLHEEDVVILRVRGVADENLVVGDDALLLRSSLACL